jgi:molybdate transport system substrate-binding protein
MSIHRPCALLLCAALHAPALAQTLTVSAATSLQEALREVAGLFQQSHPGVRVQLNFAASGSLLAQLAQGAPVDVFASADQATMDRALSKGLIDGATRRDFVANQLVLVVPRAGGGDVPSLQALREPRWRRIALGSPLSVPAGAYAQAALQQHSLWQALQPKLVYGENVRQVLSYVGRGEVDAGFDYRSDALTDARVRIALPVPTVTPLRYPAARVRGSVQPQAADAFIAFLRSPPAQPAWRRYGFEAL